MKVIIPFRLPGLNEYVDAERKHRQKAAKMKRETQDSIILVLKRQIRRPLREPVIMHYTWVEKDRKRDKDNIAFGKKFVQDALVKMRVLKNDGWNNVGGFTDDFSVDKKRPRVEIEIEEAE